eukprot:TRINITY_DN64872_c0_g1_i1.p1 TRINITY_DN64872_c0_g1~~TRINITY_DN64872_c0_g1_i1.p1  ORF type:complete len:439 (+),score=116.01 TRINITY_DN64872_c0_g1_i1:61-1377(+)
MSTEVGGGAGRGGAGPLFEPLRLPGLTLKNRIVKAATHDGTSFEEMARCYCRLARNDVALITVAYVAVCDRDKTFNTQHSVTVESLPRWAALCAAVHSAGGRISAQLHHPGLFCMSSDGTPRGPSPGYLPSRAWPLPKTLSLPDLAELRLKYATAAHLCKEAGFDALELHCGHGYLLSQFLTPLINRRGDRYGGSVERRAAFPVEVLRAVKQAAPGLPVLVKMNVDDGISQAGLPWGLGVDDAIVTAGIFARAGADAIVPSYGYTSLNGFGMLRGNVPLEKMITAMPGGGGARSILKWFGKRLVPQIEYESLFLREQSTRLLRALRADPATASCRVLYLGGADSLAACEQVLGEGFDGIQMARPLLREPFFVRRLARAARAKARAAADGVPPGSDAVARSRCVRCNMCVLSSMGPQFKPGCVLLKPGEKDIEEVAPNL